MNKSLYLFIILFSVFAFKSGYGQEHNGHDHNDHQHSHNHEISVGIGIVPLHAENTIAPGLHLHYIKGIALENRLGIGLGLETVLAEHKHYSISAVLQYRIYKGLTTVYAPGLLLLIEESEKEYLFSNHFEVAYEFELGPIHLGPMVGLGMSKDGVHYMVGAHVGVDF